MSKAIFSECRQYRYTLWRTWLDPLFAQHTIRYVNFICLNPSTADEVQDDNTIRKCIKYAKSWGYDGLCVTNLFAYRSTDRKAMQKHPEPIGPENDYYIEQVAKNAALVVAAWSQDGGHLGRSEYVRTRLLTGTPLNYLRMGAREPWHPLYLPDLLTPKEWDVTTLISTPLPTDSAPDPYTPKEQI